ncbi:hypothetical protein RJD24_14690 [Bacillaceae bacterium IKA-2]|nr:hypothetical protein RJD24_14690 [Bacillaceae bacterium IKA-2]
MLKEQKTVNICIKQYQKSNLGGHAIAFLQYYNRTSEMYFCTLGSTHYRSIMIASILAIEKLKEPCTINLYLQANVGFRYMETGRKKWVNRDIGNLLVDTVSKGNHIIKFIDCSATDKGKAIQHSLDIKVNEYRWT